MGAPTEEETKPLINNTPAVGMVVATAPAKAQQTRSWRFPLWHICGDFSPEDVAAGCLAWHAPYIAFGWNMKRALQRDFIREVLKFVLLLSGAYLVFTLAAHGLVASCGPLDLGDDKHKTDDWHGAHGDHDDHHHGDHHHDDDDHVHGPHGPDDDHHHRPCSHSLNLDSLPAECRTRVVGGMAFLVLAALVLFAFVVVYAARRRQQMRAQFGIAGTFRCDVLTWACFPLCALAQETRTLMAAQVHDGVWYGPVPGAAAHGVPATQQMEMV